ncbi:hypothetical protein LPJ70_001996 [Coemansia sp. RSA 2708]|nr:hypothetical protein LPJ70_001996 [Coemansia sp. RSA 2708]
MLHEPLAYISTKYLATSMGIMLALDSADACTMLVSARVLLSAVIGYFLWLCSLTASAGSFSLQIVGFGPMTQWQQNQIIYESQGH